MGAARERMLSSSGANCSMGIGYSSSSTTRKSTTTHSVAPCQGRAGQYSPAFHGSKHRPGSVVGQLSEPVWVVVQITTCAGLCLVLAMTCRHSHPDLEHYPRRASPASPP